MSSPKDEFNKFLLERKPFGSILADDKLEKSFRQALRVRSEELIDYLKTKEILSDIIDGLINEDGRSFQDASESLAILLADFDPVVDNVIADHLFNLFSYLDKDKHQPRRVYFFLRVMSFLFQNRNSEMFLFVNQHPEMIRKLVNHIRSPHILQLILNMLAVERQMKEFNLPNSTWSENCGLISKVVEALEVNPEENLEAVHKFFTEVCLSYPGDSDFVKNILLVQDAALIKSVIGLMDNKNTAADAIKLMDQVILAILMDNRHNEEFYAQVMDQIQSRKHIFHNLLNSDSLIMALAGTKLVQSLVKHRLSNLLEGGTLSCLHLMIKFKWSNVLHTVISDTLCSIFKSSDIELINQLLDDGKLAEKIIQTFNMEEQVGYRGHLRIVANAIRDCPSSEILSRLSLDPNWTLFLSQLANLNEIHIGYREVENRKREQIRKDQGAVQSEFILIPSDPPPPYPITITGMAEVTKTVTEKAAEGEVGKAVEKLVTEDKEAAEKVVEITKVPMEKVAEVTEIEKAVEVTEGAAEVTKAAEVTEIEKTAEVTETAEGVKVVAEEVTHPVETTTDTHQPLPQTDMTPIVTDTYT